jgi:2-hydroxychromene-2-carboxylate isomerase
VTGNAPEFGASRTRQEDAERLPIFFYDLGNPLCYLAAETVNSTLGLVPEWEPISELALTGRSIEGEVQDIARRADELSLQPLRWPAGWPPDTRTAMLAATYAKRIGRVVAFSLAAFRQAFAGGRNLGEESTVLIAGAACEMHPTALLKGMALKSVEEALQSATERARRHEVRALPAILMHGRTFCGPQAVQEAARSPAGRAP